MRKKINILHLNNSNSKSQYLLSIAKLHNKNKYNLTIGCFDNYGPIHNELKKINVNSFFIPIKKQSPLFYLIKLFVLYKFLKKNKIEILHLHTFFPSFFGLIVGKLAGVKQIIMTRHHADAHLLLNKNLHIKIDSWTAKRCDKIIAVSEITKKTMVIYESVPENKIKVINNGLEPLKLIHISKLQYFEEFGIDENMPILLCISRLHVGKNIETAIKAIKIIKDLGIKSYLLIAGAGIGNDYHKKLLKLSNDLMINDQIFFLGFRDDVGDLLSISDALIHPSLYESFGFTILEAMSLKIPVFTSDIPAIRETATADVANFFEPGNEIELSKLLINWLSNRRIMDGKLLKGLERCENYFTFKSMMEAYESYYEKK